jgi:membrane protease YdiL (CAAX protease family)
VDLLCQALPNSPRQRGGLVVAIVALGVALNPLNRQFAVWLRDEVVTGVPYWLDHIAFMVTLMLVVWGLIGLLILGPRGTALGLPSRPREAWFVGILSGIGLTALVLIALRTLGPVTMQPHPNWPVLFANFASNFYEEFIYRGVILGLLLKALNGQHRWLAALLSALLFTQGHLHYPPALIAVVLVAGLTWAWLTIRYQSLWPAWVSHMLADTIIDNLFKT